MAAGECAAPRRAAKKMRGSMLSAVASMSEASDSIRTEHFDRSKMLHRKRNASTNAHAMTQSGLRFSFVFLNKCFWEDLFKSSTQALFFYRNAISASV
jgi:hypothetical protein